MILISVMVLGACPKNQPSTAIESSTCTHRQDRPELGSPLHSKSGGTGAPRERLQNGTKVKIVRTKGDWHLVRIAGSGRSGWIKSNYLGKCSAVGGAQKTKRLRKRGSAKEAAGKSHKIKAHSTDASSIKLCWWNAKRLGHGKRDWKATARAVKGCDIVGLGEVMTFDAPIKLAKAMGPGWVTATSKTSVGTKNYKEFYAVLFDSTRVKTVRKSVKGYFQDIGDHFVREPWSISLKAGNFDFTLVLLHVIWGEKAAERTAELMKVDDAFRWFQERDLKENDIILMGDFNRTPTQNGWEQVRQMGLKLLISGKGTTVNSRGEVKNLYDQIIIDPRHTKEWTGQAGITGDVDVDLSKFRRTVSDHLPVWAGFGIVGRDDD